MTDSQTVDTPAGHVPAALYTYLDDERRALIAQINRLSRLLGKPGVVVRPAERDKREGRS